MTKWNQSLSLDRGLIGMKSGSDIYHKQHYVDVLKCDTLQYGVNPSKRGDKNEGQQNYDEEGTWKQEKQKFTFTSRTTGEAMCMGMNMARDTHKKCKDKEKYKGIKTEKLQDAQHNDDQDTSSSKQDSSAEDDNDEDGGQDGSENDTIQYDEENENENEEEGEEEIGEGEGAEDGEENDDNVDDDEEDDNIDDDEETEDEEEEKDEDENGDEDGDGDKDGNGNNIDAKDVQRKNSRSSDGIKTQKKSSNKSKSASKTEFRGKLKPKSSPFKIDMAEGTSGGRKRVIIANEAITAESLMDTYIGQVGALTALGVQSHEVLNQYVWNNLLDSDERVILRGYLPKCTDTEVEKCLESFFGRKEETFGRIPLDEAWNSILSGHTHPKFLLAKERLMIQQRRHYLQSIKEYHNTFVRRVRARKQRRLEEMEAKDEPLSPLNMGRTTTIRTGATEMTERRDDGNDEE